MKAAVDNMTVEIPEPMVLAKLDEQLRNYISTMGISPELTHVSRCSPPWAWTCEKTPGDHASAGRV